MSGNQPPINSVSEEVSLCLYHNSLSKQQIHPDILNAISSVDLPEVQEMMRRLSQFGLGIMVPHYHTDEENFAPLPNGMVQFENDLQVSFKNRSEIGEHVIPVGWRWKQESVEAIMICVFCHN